MDGRRLARAAGRPGCAAHPLVLGAGRADRLRAGQRGVLGRAAAARRGLRLRATPSRLGEHGGVAGAAPRARPDAAGRAADSTSAGSLVGGRAARHARGAGARRARNRAVRPDDARQRARLRAHPTVLRRVAARRGDVPAGGLGVHRGDGAAGARYRSPFTPTVAAVGGARRRTADRAGVVGLPASGRAALQPVHARSRTESCGAASSRSGRRNMSPSPRCWWPTRPGVRRP